MSLDKAERHGRGAEERVLNSTRRKDDEGRRPMDTFGFHSQIPWTEEETQHVKELLEYLTVQLKEQEGSVNQLPVEETKLLMTTIQKFLMQEELDRNDPLLGKISYYFHDVQCVDLHKVSSILIQNKQAGDSLEGKKVILLLGNPSSGKTTTLLSLAGTTFKEAVVDGFVHLEPTQFLDAAVAGYSTSCGRESVTKNLQTATVKIQDEEYIVCDTPAFGDYESIEEEIAQKYGLVNAISKAQSIRPIFVLSQECLGNRMNGLPQVFDMIMKHFHLRSMTNDVIPFQYVFTRFDERHRTRLWKMFKYYKDSNPPYDGDEPELFLKIVNDMVEKSKPEANVVAPVTDIPRYLLKKVTENPTLECEPRESMKASGENESLALLHVQFKLTLYGVLMFLASQDYEAAVERVQHLKDLSTVLETAETYYELAVKACERYTIVLWESFHDRIEQQDYMSALAHVNQSMQLSTALPQVEESVQLDHSLFWKALVDNEMKRMAKGRELTTSDCVLQMRDAAKLSPEMNAEIAGGIRRIRGILQKELAKEEGMTDIVPHFRLLLLLAIGFREGAKIASEMLDRLESRIMDRIKDQEFQKATDDLLVIGPLALRHPDQFKFTVYAVKTYKHNLEQAMDKNVFETAGETLYYLARLKLEYPEAGMFCSRGLDKLWKKFEYAIKQREYATAICIIKHLGKVAQISKVAFERSRLGIEVIRDRLFKSIESKNYGMAQVLMQQLTKLEKVLPREAPIDIDDSIPLRQLKKKKDRRRRTPSPAKRMEDTRKLTESPDRQLHAYQSKKLTDSPERHQPPGYRSKRDEYYEDEVGESKYRTRRSSDRGHDDQYREGRDDRGHRRRYHGKERSSRQEAYEGRDDAEGEVVDERERRGHRRSRRKEKGYHRDDYEGRDDVEDEHDAMSELTMSIVAPTKFRSYDPDKFVYENDQPPPPVSKIAVSHRKGSRGDDRRDSPQKRQSRRHHHYEEPLDEEMPPPPVSKIALPSMRDYYDEERRDSPMKRSTKKHSPRHKSRYDNSPEKRRSRGYDRTRDYDDDDDSRDYHERKSRPSKSPQKSKRVPVYDDEPPVTSRYEATKRKSSRPSATRETRERYEKESPSPRKSRIPNHGSDGDSLPFDEFRGYSNGSRSLPALKDEDASVEKKHHRKSKHRSDSRSRSSRSSQSSFYTGPPIEETSMYRRERLRRVDVDNASRTSWDI